MLLFKMIIFYYKTHMYIIYTIYTIIQIIQIIIIIIIQIIQIIIIIIIMIIIIIIIIIIIRNLDWTSVQRHHSREARKFQLRESH